MGDYEITCVNCGWLGTDVELICSEEGDKSDKPVSQIEFNLCPDCGGINIDDISDDGVEL